jgi:hypothetical protein
MAHALSLFLADPAGIATKGMLIAAGLDFVFGVYASLHDEPPTFALDVLAAFVRKHLLGRVLPIGTLLFVGYLAHDGSMTLAGGIAAAAYTAETLASIYGSIRPPAASVTAEANPSELVNPVPTD